MFWLCFHRAIGRVTADDDAKVYPGLCFASSGLRLLRRRKPLEPRSPCIADKIVDEHHRFNPAQLTSLMKLMSSRIGFFERSRKKVVVPLAFKILSMACVNGTSTGGSLA